MGKEERGGAAQGGFVLLFLFTRNNDFESKYIDSKSHFCNEVPSSYNCCSIYLTNLLDSNEIERIVIFDFFLNG